MPQVYCWELFHEELADMYLLYNMQLKDIMIEISTQYNFNPSQCTYRLKFAEWEFTKKQEFLYKDIYLVNKVKEL
ncbi:hypothetical protein B9Z19DRAFT_1138403 [Tuber borchii]|uniref:Clr5 domain-containing protein n=1 Tax=Tuber borchii TaxID=42251 RepID=A0A2T6Z9V2_TUBBO|nr:hypothetical protein B9Z19DRAFT_1138403 [Tuber borchii]